MMRGRLWYSITEVSILKQPLKLAITCFVISVLLEVVSHNSFNDLRLFAGAFLVLGIAFLIYTFEQYSAINEFLIFDHTDQISEDHLVNPLNDEYLLHANNPYLFVDNSLFINWHHRHPIKKFFYGIAAAFGGMYLNRKNSQYIQFSPNKSIYVKTIDIHSVINSDRVRILDSGDARRYHTPLAIAGLYFVYSLSMVYVISLVVYIIYQLLK